MNAERIETIKNAILQVGFRDCAHRVQNNQDVFVFGPKDDGLPKLTPEQRADLNPDEQMNLQDGLQYTQRDERLKSVVAVLQAELGAYPDLTSMVDGYQLVVVQKPGENGNE